MTKGQISESDLDAGLKGMGGLTGLSEKSRRDSPFGKPSGERPQAVDSRKKRGSRSVAGNGTKQTDEETTRRNGAAKRGTDVASTRATTAAAAVEPHEAVTLPLPVSLRDEVSALAKELQRRRTEKKHRITTNTVMRALIEVGLGELKLEGDDHANNERELVHLVRAKLGLVGLLNRK